MVALKPCGTFAAYNRHRRRHEPVDDACAQAARDQKNVRVDAKRDASAQVVQLTLASTPPTDPSPLDDALENLAIVKAAMASAPANAIAALSKRREELVASVERLKKADKPEESALDQLARRRAERLAKASH